MTDLTQTSSTRMGPGGHWRNWVGNQSFIARHRLPSIVYGCPGTARAYFPTSRLDRLRAMTDAENYAVAKLVEHGAEAKLTDLLRELVDCTKSRSATIHDRCKAVYGKPRA
jgi:hypothetical protein